MSIITLQDHVVGITPSGNLEIEDMHRKLIKCGAELILPDKPNKITIPAGDVSKLRQFMDDAASKS